MERQSDKASDDKGQQQSDAPREAAHEDAASTEKPVKGVSEAEYDEAAQQAVKDVHG